MWSRGNDPFHQLSRAGFALAILAVLLGVSLLSGASLGSTIGILRGLGGLALIIGAGAAIRAWFRT
jgi:hypothetical protein